MYIKYLILTMLLFSLFCTQNPVSPSSSLENAAFSTDLKTGDTLSYYYESNWDAYGHMEHLIEISIVSIDTIIFENHNYLIHTTISRGKWDTVGLPLDTIYEKTTIIDSCIVMDGMVTKNVDSILFGMFYSYPLKGKELNPPLTFVQADTIVSLPDTTLNCESYAKERNVAWSYFFENQIYAKSSRILVGYIYQYNFQYGSDFTTCQLTSIKHKNPF